MRLRSRSSFMFAAFAYILLLTACGAPAWTQQWQPIGPEGGSVRSLSQDPLHPDRIFLGTSAGRLYLSTDNGVSWSRYARLGKSSEMVLDHILIDPVEPLNMYVTGWNAQAPNSDGDLFRSQDGGQTWEIVPELHGKSIRALALSPSNPRTLVAGALDGIFRSKDGGENWERISPENHAELKQVESIAIDPANPDVIYAGTWHLPWKTEDGGKSWRSVRKGVIDDSDVFSIVVDAQTPAIVYISACSGIYRSDNAGELFRKIQGIPYSARRTRSLRMDPLDHNTVYAGTTEGLWKTTDAGLTWSRVTGANVIVNDVLIDPRRPAHLLLATDRGGVLASNDAGATFTASNHGFSHRQVSALLVNRADPSVIFAGLINDKEFGGVFVSRDRGQSWTQLSDGLDGRDVLALRQTGDGTLLAGTDRGIFLLKNSTTRWLQLNGEILAAGKGSNEDNDKSSTQPVVLDTANPSQTAVDSQAAAIPTRDEAMVRPASSSRSARKTAPKPAPLEIKSRVTALEVTKAGWFASTAAGFLMSADSGNTWRRMQLPGLGAISSVAVADKMVVLASRTGIVASVNGGESWLPGKPFLHDSAINSVAVEANGDIWVAAHEGIFRSSDMGDTWKRLTLLRLVDVASVQFDEARQRILAMSAGSGSVFESHDDGRTWSPINSGWSLETFVSVQGRLVGITPFDGIVMQPEDSVSMR